MNGRHPPTPGRRPGARVGSVRGMAPVAPLPPPRPSPTRHASPSQSPECAKVRVSQVRKSSCLLTRHPRRESRGTAPLHSPSHSAWLGKPPSRTAHPAWNAGFSRHPRRESAAEPHRFTLLHILHGSKHHPPVPPTRLGTPASAGTRDTTAPRNRTASLSFTFCMARNTTLPYRPPGLERRPVLPVGASRPAPAAQERRGTAPNHPPSPKNQAVP